MTAAPVTPRSLPRSDDQLMTQVKGADLEAFATLYKRYYARVFGLTRSICRDEGRAQEAAQETFVSIWRSRASYRSGGTPAAWVLAVARHRAIDVSRRNQPHTTHRAGEELLDTQPARIDIADDVVARAQACIVRDLLAQLPDAQREAITLSFYGQLSHTEIATQLGLPVGTVKGRVRLGLEKLRLSPDL